MLLKLLLAFLIFTNEIIYSSFIANIDEDKKDQYEVSPVSTTFIPDPPNLTSKTLLKCKTNGIMRIEPKLQTLSYDLIIFIAGYLEFPHYALGSLNRDFNQFFKKISPSKLISNQLEFAGLSTLPLGSDLKYLTSFSSSDFKGERLLSIIIDVALVKALPKIKSSLLRLLYSRSLNCLSKSQWLSPTHPFKAYSPISAVAIGFLESNDFELLFDIFERFPEVIMKDSAFRQVLIEAADKLNKLTLIY